MTYSRPRQPDGAGEINPLDYCRSQIKNSLSTGRLLAVNARQRVYVWPYHGDGSRFVKLFRETWRRLPLWARRRILRLWHNTKDAELNLEFVLSPRIVLLDGWSMRNSDNVGVTIGCVSAGGHMLKFHAPTIDLMPKPLVMDVIAHELAHVHQNACGIRLKSVNCDGTVRYETARGEILMPGQIEDDADETMLTWGFDPDAMDEWAVQQGLVTVRDGTFEDFLERYERFMNTGV